MGILKLIYFNIYYLHPIINFILATTSLRPSFSKAKAILYKFTILNNPIKFKGLLIL